MRRKLGVISLLIGLLYLSGLSWAHAQSGIQIVEQSINSRFRDAITARIRAEHDREITSVEFFYRIAGRITTSRNAANFEPGQTIEASFRINQRAFYLPPGTEIEYWWRLSDADGNIVKTEPASYLYLDNRFDFKTRSNDRLTLYWYNGNRTFGDALFEQAVKALDRLEADVGVIVERPIKIFIYGTHEDLINAISLGAREWTGGVAYTDQGVVVIGIEPDRLEWGLRAMTHELTHLVVHQAVNNPYNDLPTWLGEGVAVYNESPEALIPAYQEAMAAAVARDALFTLRTLSSSFPADPEEAHLAYAQSGAVFHFMMAAYGPEAMTRFLEIFSDGVLVDRALREALGVETWDIDNAFRASLGLPALPALPGALSKSQDAQFDRPETDQAEGVEAAETQPADVAAPETRRENAPPPAAEAQKRGWRLACLGGLLPLTTLGLVVAQRRRDLFAPDQA